MKPLKIKSIKYKDNRGYLVELVPNKIKKRFNYSIITQSKKNVIRGMHYNKKKDEEKLVYILEGKILDVTINLNKGKDYGRIFYNTNHSAVYLDSPATTSSTTYKVQLKTYGTSNGMKLVYNQNSSKSTILVMEVSG